MKKLNDILSSLFILPVKFYQLSISPFLPQSCRHVPTCSQYAIESLRLHGPFKGSWFAIRRILHCHPWGTSGYDPVPPIGHPTLQFKKYKPEKHV